VSSKADLSWDDLRYFLRAAEAKTLAGAARALGVEHTTIGRRLSALERALGAPLVVRGSDGIKLTPLGERLLPVVRELERGVTTVQDLARCSQTRVRLALPSGLSQLFTGRLADLRSRHPELALELSSGARAVDLKNGEADLAIRAGPIQDDELIARRLGEMGWSLYAAESYLARRGKPNPLDDLSEHDVIGYDPLLAATPAAQWLEAHATRAHVVLRSREMTDMVSAAAGGIGLALLPCVLADAEPKLTRLSPEVLATREIWLVYRRETTLSEPVRTVVDFVLDTMRAHTATMGGRVAAKT
jgi:DNA-binding transcriptional LysR family regulator